jgi:hypothetical protein
MVVSAFIASSVLIRRVVSKRRDGDADETNCAKAEDQKAKILEKKLFIRVV